MFRFGFRLWTIFKRVSLVLGALLFALILGACAIPDRKVSELTARFAAVFFSSHASKRVFGETGINSRPSGGTHGFPSAHTAAATFGASALVHDCLPKVPVVQAPVIPAPYAGIGAGIAVPHVDVTPAGGPQTFGYQLSGPALQPWSACAATCRRDGRSLARSRPPVPATIPNLKAAAG